MMRSTLKHLTLILLFANHTNAMQSSGDTTDYFSYTHTHFKEHGPHAKAVYVTDKFEIKLDDTHKVRIKSDDFDTLKSLHTVFNSYPSEEAPINYLILKTNTP